MKGRLASAIDGFAEFASQGDRGMWIAAVLALLLALPTLRAGFALDDWWHLAWIALAPREAVFRLFDFTPATNAQTGGLEGVWWGDPEMRLAFLRPLTGAFGVLDMRLFGIHPLGWHLTSLLWRVGVVLAGASVFKRTLPGHLWVLAALLFAIDDGGIATVGWIANRNALIATLPVLLGFCMHLEWRRTGSWFAGILAPALYAIGLAGGEAAVCGLAYVAAWELIGTDEPWQRRALALVPATLVGAVWIAIWKLGGYGAHASGMYLDPIADPVGWLFGAPMRGLAMLGGLLVDSPVDLWVAAEQSHPLLAIVGALSAWMWWVLWRSSREDRDDAEARALRAYGLGAILALVPLVSTSPTSRLLLVPALGGCAVAAGMLRWWWRVRWTEQDPGRKRRLLCGVLAIVTVIVPPITWCVQGTLFANQTQVLQERALEAELEPDAGSTVFYVLAPPDPSTALYTPAARWLSGSSLPAGWRVVDFADCPHRITRESVDTFRIETLGCSIMSSEFERAMRDPARKPFHAGDVVRMSAFDVEVIEAPDGLPTVFLLVVRDDMDHVQFLTADEDLGMVRMPMPEVGGSVRVPGGTGLYEAFLGKR